MPEDTAEATRSVELVNEGRPNYRAYRQTSQPASRAIVVAAEPHALMPRVATAACDGHASRDRQRGLTVVHAWGAVVAA
jgi:hypothetical protein